jgi:pentatricopeptide repeat protein
MTQAYKLEPTLKTCREFLLAVGRGPHFVKGFEDLMFDAMALIEGKELVPDAGIYEGIIEGFARARDPVAAEYYFWEIKRKNIAPTVRVYNYLLQAYFGAQTVGARKYGHFGRWSRPVAKEPTPDERDLAQLGPVRVAKICKYMELKY